MAITRSSLLNCIIVVACIACLLQFCSCHKKDGKAVEQAREHMVVILDPAHGGTDTGTRADNGKLEKDMVLAYCREVAARALSYNIEIVLTRNEDKNPTADERRAAGGTLPADAFVSVHINKDFPGRPVQGYEVFIVTGGPEYARSSALATQLMATLKEAGKDTLLTPKNVLTLVGNTRPAIAIECGNIDNADDVAAMEDPGRLCHYLLASLVKYGNNR